jgi:anti-anti-sigma factor
MRSATSLINDAYRTATISQFHGPKIVDFKVECSNGVAVVTVTGELDVSNTSSLYTCLRDAINSGMTELRLDVEHLTFLGSSGLAVILGADKQMRALGGTFTVMAPTPFVERLFRRSGDVPHPSILPRVGGWRCPESQTNSTPDSAA